MVYFVVDMWFVMNGMFTTGRSGKHAVSTRTVLRVYC